MWLAFAFLSAALLGFYDVFKKHSLNGNAVIPVLCLNTLFSSLIFIPFVVISVCRPAALQNTIFYMPMVAWDVHKYIILKSVIVLSSWILGYYGIKHIPLTITGPINATRPVLTLLGAMMVFGERLNGYQWIGVALSAVSFVMLSRSGKKEGIDFKHDRWIYFLVLSNLLGAVSALYDKYLMMPVADGGIGMNPMVVQGWYNMYQFLMMAVILMVVWFPMRTKTTPFRWDWCIILISIFLAVADFVYFYALSLPGAMISIVSMVRRGSVLVSFFFGAWMFREKNLRSKVVDLILVLLGMVFLWIGSE